MKTVACAGIRNEGRLLYALLDAVEEEGRLDAFNQAQWRAAKARVVQGNNYECEAESMHAVLNTLRTSGALQGTWIEQRCATLEARLNRN